MGNRKLKRQPTVAKISREISIFFKYRKRQRKWPNSRRKTIKLLIQKIKIENFREPLLEKPNSTKRTKWCQKSRKRLWVPKLKANLTLGTFYMLKVGEKC